MPKVPTLLLLHIFDPQTEPLLREARRNAEWFCRSCPQKTMSCIHEQWRALPARVEAFHPWFSRFSAAHQLLSGAPRAHSVDHILWLDPGTVFATAESPQFLASALALLKRSPLVLPVSLPLQRHDAAAMPRAYLSRNTSAALRVLAQLSSYLPRDDRPWPPDRGFMQHGYAYDGERRATMLGAAGQLELLLSSESPAAREAQASTAFVPEEILLGRLPTRLCDKVSDFLRADDRRAAYFSLCTDVSAEMKAMQRRTEHSSTRLPIAFVHVGCGSVLQQRELVRVLTDLAGSRASALDRGSAQAPERAMLDAGASAARPAPGPADAFPTPVDKATATALEAVPESANNAKACAVALTCEPTMATPLAETPPSVNDAVESASESDDGGNTCSDEAGTKHSSMPSPPLAPTPSLLVIVFGEEFALQRTPLFVRSLLSARSGPLNLYVLGDTAGLRGFRTSLRVHGEAEGLIHPHDEIIYVAAAASVLAQGFLAELHPSCHARGYAYLFLKLLAPELLPAVDHLIILDPDVAVLADVSQLWSEFGFFDPSHVVSMAVDQSDRYYYRLSDPLDEVYSEGWAKVPHRVGVNGGVLLLHAARARAVGLSGFVSRLTHEGARQREGGTLTHFCALAEQDTINLAIAHHPSMWKPLDCTWNYMATELGGHTMVIDPTGPLSFLDACEHGTTGSQGAVPGDLLRCSCGQRVKILHFVGAVRQRPLLQTINQTVLSASGTALRSAAAERAALPLTEQRQTSASP